MTVHVMAHGRLRYFTASFTKATIKSDKCHQFYDTTKITAYVPYFICTAGVNKTDKLHNFHDLTHAHLQAVKGDLDTSSGVIYPLFSAVRVALKLF